MELHKQRCKGRVYLGEGCDTQGFLDKWDQNTKRQFAVESKLLYDSSWLSWVNLLSVWACMVWQAHNNLFFPVLLLISP